MTQGSINLICKWENKEVFVGKRSSDVTPAYFCYEQ